MNEESIVNLLYVLRLPNTGGLSVGWDANECSVTFYGFYLMMLGGS